MSALLALLTSGMFGTSAAIESHFMTNWDEKTMLLEGTQWQRLQSLPYDKICECQCDDLIITDPVTGRYIGHTYA